MPQIYLWLYLLTCICLWRRLFRVTLEISRTVINLAYRVIVTSQRGHWPLLIGTRYVCTCVGAGSGMGGGIRKIKAIRWGAYYYSLVLTLILLTWRIRWAPNNASKWQMGFNSAFKGLNAQPCKYDMYKSSLIHIHDPVLSSLKMKGIRFYLLSEQLSWKGVFKWNGLSR
jgi:hypothetical protein